MPDSHHPTLFEKLRSESEKHELVKPAGLRYSATIRYVIMVLTALLCALYFPADHDNNAAIALGSEWTQDTVKADRAFTIFKPGDQFENDVIAARDSTPPVFVEQSDVQGRVRDSLRTFYRPFLVEEEFDTDSLAALSLLSQPTIALLRDIPLDERRALLRRISGTLIEFQTEVHQTGLIDIEKGQIKTREVIVWINETTERLEFTGSLIDFTDFQLRVTILLENFTELGKRIANELLEVTMIPNLIYSPEISRFYADLAEQSVPRTLGIVRAGEVIVRPDDRVTPEILNRLLQLRRLEGERHPLLVFFGNFGHSILVYSILLLFIHRIRRRIWNDNFKFIGISFCLVLIAFFAWLSVSVGSSLPVEFLIIVPACSMLVAILFDSRTAFYATITMTLIMAGVRGNDYETAFAVLVGSTYAAYTVRDLRSRTQVFKSIASIFIGYSLAIIALSLQHTTQMPEVLEKLAMGTINAIISPVLTLGLLFVIERIFNIATDLRLLEYDNLNHPLLVQLAEKAPGTFEHTRTVAHLAESAARSIDANPILTRVGTYFHDIGKLAKSEYFVENQIDIANKHDRLTPAKSASIIKNHVKDGVELGEEYRLPRRILDFVPMHHGTMLIKHFYAQALEEASEGGAAVNEDHFRYPGPKPNSNETAIVMLADSVEALSRTLDNSNRESLEKSIDNIIKERLLDGQLDNSDLSLKDLNAVKESFVRNLVGMGHRRIKYKKIPGEEKSDDKSAAAPGEQPAGQHPHV